MILLQIILNILKKSSDVSLSNNHMGSKNLGSTCSHQGRNFYKKAWLYATKKQKNEQVWEFKPRWNMKMQLAVMWWFELIFISEIVLLSNFIPFQAPENLMER